MTPQARVHADIASCVILVSDLERSLAFYRDVFACDVALHEREMALLLTSNGFQVYLHVREQLGRHRHSEYPLLIWATESETELQKIAERLRTYDAAVYSRTEDGITLLEGLDPDRARVIVAFPSPCQHPRTSIPELLRNRPA